MSHFAKPIVKNTGETAAERYLARLCNKSFLSLWSYPGVYRDQGRTEGKGDGKEVCDLLVVFGDHVIIFSDKDCEFKDTGRVELDWRRWFRKSILSSAHQIWGAEKWIRGYQGKLFIDKKCQVPLPINLPNADEMKVHRIVVAHDRSGRCRAIVGGSGSLLLSNYLEGESHLNTPFTVGHLERKKGFVHVFDDTSLNIVMKSLDTVFDFVSYLEKKKNLFNSNLKIHAAGEEELLAIYLSRTNKEGEHDFEFPKNVDVISIDQGFWNRYQSNTQRLAQIEDNKISYMWDAIIEKFNHHMLMNTQYTLDGRAISRPVAEQELGFRVLAAEPRTRRRLLATGLAEVLERSKKPGSFLEARVVLPSHDGDPHYVFVTLRRPSGVTEEAYRIDRANILTAYCTITKLVHKEAQQIIGFATESGDCEGRSEDLCFRDVRNWSSEDEREAVKLQEKTGFLKKVNTFSSRVLDYPVDATGKRPNTNISRNSTCPCGTGKRYKRCCGKIFSGRKERNPHKRMDGSF